MIDWLHQLTLPNAALWALALNVFVFVTSLVFGEILVRMYRDQPVTAPPDPLEWAEVLLALSCVLLNSLVAFAGWWMWRSGYITLRPELGWRVVVDLFVLIVVMDFCMYVLHRVAHHPWVYPIAHQTHHRYDRPRPLNLFVLNPFEVLGFGTLWLLVLCCYSFTWAGAIAFLTINTISGTLGHLGVEPFPKSWKRLPVLKYLGSSTFHADHHQDGHVNYGFYTTIWDKLFRTIKL